MEKGTVVTTGRYYQLADGEIGIVGFKLKVGGGFLGMTNDGVRMPRWWNDLGIDNRDKNFNIIREVDNPNDPRKNTV